ncbi:MAG TPA: hypothetical protein VGM31_00640 [Puia sp.]|jgi:NADH:ubiquinone oxidoreductase subunit 2 (subunit N)
MLLTLLVILAVISMLVSVISFVLFIRARLAVRAHPDDEDADVARDAELDRKERSYQSIHFLSLLIFLVLGVLILIMISHKVNG